MTQADEWRDRAACQGAPSEFFFGLPDRYGVDHHDPVLLAEGKRLCHGCEVKVECLAKALDLGKEAKALGLGKDVDGLWGGTTKKERESLARCIRRAKCPVCQGASLHLVGALQVCGDCGQSWVIVRPSQARLNADKAA